MITCSIGIMAHNEEKNIARTLEALLSQKLKQVIIKEIYVIASGCTDLTVPISKRFAKTDKRIKILIQRRRKGKTSAVNLFLKNIHSHILVLVGADTIPQKDVVEKLVCPLAEPKIGMTGAHPIPVDPQDSFFGFAAHLLWELHHQVALTSPKLGEMVAFKRVFERIPYPAITDEATIEPLIISQGYKLMYIPGAIVFNKGTENLSEFISQRRRIHAGHVAVKRIYDYCVSTLSKEKLLLAWIRSFRFQPKFIFWSPLVVILELTAWVLGSYDAHFKKDRHVIWEVARSTKNLNVLSLSE